MTKKECFSSWLSLNWDIGLRLPLDSDSDWNLHHWLFWFSGLWTWSGTLPLAPLGLHLVNLQLSGLLSLHNVIKQFLITSFSIYVSIYVSICVSIYLSIYLILLVLFLWRTQTNRPSLTLVLGLHVMDWQCSPLPWREGTGLLLLSPGSWISCPLPWTLPSTDTCVCSVCSGLCLTGCFRLWAPLQLLECGLWRTMSGWFFLSPCTYTQWLIIYKPLLDERMFSIPLHNGIE